MTHSQPDTYTEQKLLPLQIKSFTEHAPSGLGQGWIGYSRFGYLNFLYFPYA